MRDFKKLILKITIVLMTTFCVFAICEQVQAKENEDLTQQEIEYYSRNIDVNEIDKEDILKAYDELSEKYSNEEIANIIEENKEEIKKQGISEDVISAGTTLLKTTDTERVKEIIENDIDVEEIKEKLEQGYTPNQALKSTIEEIPNEKKAEIIIKMFLANQIIKIAMVVIIILFIYRTILRWIIYKKAGKHGWAAIIPIYRQIVLYQICELSPALMLFWLVPIIGWIIMLIVAIMKRFYLAKAFQRGTAFGFGLLLFPTIFNSILAFSK